MAGTLPDDPTAPPPGGAVGSLAGPGRDRLDVARPHPGDPVVVPDRVEGLGALDQGAERGAAVVVVARDRVTGGHVGLPGREGVLRQGGGVAALHRHPGARVRRVLGVGAAVDLHRGVALGLQDDRGRRARDGRGVAASWVVEPGLLPAVPDRRPVALPVRDDVPAARDDLVAPVRALGRDLLAQVGVAQRGGVGGRCGVQVAEVDGLVEGGADLGGRVVVRRGARGERRHDLDDPAGRGHPGAAQSSAPSRDM